MDGNTIEKTTLKDNLLKLDSYQLKMFYSMLVHYFVHHQAFISKQNIFNQWCEFNYACAEADESFPDPYDDYDLLKSFCHNHLYYFIDILSPKLVINLFCEHLDSKVDVLIEVANKLSTGGLRAAYECCNKALGMNEDVDNLVLETEAYIGYFT